MPRLAPVSSTHLPEMSSTAISCDWVIGARPDDATAARARRGRRRTARGIAGPGAAPVTMGSNRRSLVPALPARSAFMYIYSPISRLGAALLRAEATDGRVDVH